MRRYLLLVVVLLAVAALGIGLALALSWNNLGLQYREEWVRALLQVGLIGALGVVTAWVLELFKEARQQRIDEGKLRLDLLAAVSRDYMKVKLVRRRVQASPLGFTAAESDELNKIQVRYELHKLNSISLIKQGHRLEELLGRMEKYLDHVANKADSPERRGFASKEGFSCFAGDFHVAHALLQEDIASR